MPDPALSIVIPTRDRPDHLTETLAALAKETGDGGFEVIVVDDGSAPGSLPSIQSRTWPFPCRWLRQEPLGPAAARNRGLSEARGPRALLLGDDTRPAPGGLRPHFSAAELGVQGHIDWDPEQEITEVMEFLAPAGPQFYFKGLEDGVPVPFTAVLGSNFSAPLRWFQDDPFDEGFPHAALEDTELAYRFQRRGRRTCYQRAALCWHHHIYSELAPFLDRQERAGRSARYALSRQPGMLATVLLKPLLFTAVVMARAGLRRGDGPAEQKARWDLQCRLAFFRGVFTAPIDSAAKLRR